MLSRLSAGTHSGSREPPLQRLAGSIGLRSRTSDNQAESNNSRAVFERFSLDLNLFPRFYSRREVTRAGLFTTRFRRIFGAFGEIPVREFRSSIEEATDSDLAAEAGKDGEPGPPDFLTDMTTDGPRPLHLHHPTIPLPPATFCSAAVARATPTDPSHEPSGQPRASIEPRRGSRDLEPCR
ncbi:calcium-dependent lipid-binding family protein [Striga asiatica]|uniref:Calcium-dependent lipid-binding family protein n=1 Tax=Striga asiatica TaxID=4170 RepID=A0A5A7Q629_STRAF|nr:calcium-dependent lipid-binding family protein [Striga asiatica]